MKAIRVGVTGLNAVDSPGPGVPILRCLAESSIPTECIGLVYDVLEPGNFMKDLVDKVYLIPYPSSGSASLLERLRFIHSQFNLDVIIPALDSELENFIRISPELKKMGISLCLPTLDQLHLRDKTKLKSTLDDSDVLIPETYMVQDASTIAQIAEKIGYPFFVKGLFYEAFLAKNLEEATGYFYYLAGKWGIPIILQQSILGEEVNCAAFARNGEMISHVVMKKMFVTDKGKAWAGVTINNPEVSKISKNILAKLGWNSGCELEFLVKNKSGKIFLLEINPRFPAWVYLTAACGVNLPEALLKTAIGMDLAPINKYDIGKVFVRHSWDEIIPLEQIASLSVHAELNHKDKK
jgi:carbamoyl-phosphate synthase large subunit